MKQRPTISARGFQTWVARTVVALIDGRGVHTRQFAGTHDRVLGARRAATMEDDIPQTYSKKKLFRDGGFRSANRAFGDWQIGRTGFRMDRSPSPRDQLTLQGDAYSGEAGQRTAITIFSAPRVGHWDASRIRAQAEVGRGAVVASTFGGGA